MYWLLLDLNYLKEDISLKFLVKTKIVLPGAGGNCLDIYEALIEIGKYEICGYLNPIEDLLIKEQTDLNYLGNEKNFNFKNIDGLVITFAGLGRNIKSRKLAFEKYKKNSISLLFKNASISNYCNVSDKGVVIFGQTVVKSFCKIEENIFINSGTIIGHHVEIKKNTVISIGVFIGGGAIIGEEVFIGMGARIFQKVKIGKGSIIGAGVIVRKDIPDYSKIY